MGIDYKLFVSDSWHGVPVEPKGPLGEFVLGVADTVSAVYHFPDDVLKHVNGTDSYLGERTPWKYIGQKLDLDNKIFHFETIINAVDTVNGMVYGTVDLITGHLPYYIFNKGLKLDIPYFSPAPANARELGQQTSMGALIAVTPSAKASLLKALKAEKPAFKPVARQEIAGAQKPAANMPAATGMFDLKSALTSEAGFIDASFIQRPVNFLRALYYRSVGNLTALVEVARTGNKTALNVLSKIAKTDAKAAYHLSRLAERGIGNAQQIINNIEIPKATAKEWTKTYGWLRFVEGGGILHEGVVADLAKAGNKSVINTAMELANKKGTRTIALDLLVMAAESKNTNAINFLKTYALDTLAETYKRSPSDILYILERVVPWNDAAVAIIAKFAQYNWDAVTVLDSLRAKGIAEAVEACKKVDVSRWIKSAEQGGGHERMATVALRMLAKDGNETARSGLKVLADSGRAEAIEALAYLKIQ